MSTGDQDLALQVDALRAAGVTEENLFTDVVSGARADRPGLSALLAAASPGDTIVTWRLDRLGRSVLNLADLAEQLRARGIGIRSLSDGVDTSTVGGRLLYGLLSVLAEFERETIKDRVRAGMAAARRSGVHCGRRPTLKAEHVADARVRLAAGQTARSVARFLRVSEATLYRALARHPAPVASPPAA
ncbi:MULTISPECIES: recombinase family protein [Roseomonas]|uniref:recombinase family protein n=1 Tax=Roseomonas TaxID=125216 RepID=UPI001F188F9C|nr:recombinase family protein [Roseomonas gilardii]